ncbi:Plasmodium exported protein, unknown function [Plasmodium knowlesi strain H]|uniref:Fam-h protein n=3 Tax=Plasmodium knowlesi TaxID=5850 RepID=A0A5K1TW64_PLAKH|nr:Plasmodium exported protein, unknown function [Plasmodium knowlesi strain H]OTN65764.1 Uncharacterized protein PKNOH_S100069900 [Plasmodium knowlesi]CAA9988048.1 Plasmodium exported protein, unknown function [Plasmodium knowlesi strain H]SBO21951.1 Plasmodium exported protein, unknown function [Plasmodium knowlesi strain H]SBO29503.1 Plasmodium exported protein, unknown function [Plasmodium knowlesi strain H]VVS77522.1 Plasmodium exported protein, unknown function [Plasmodium knowlesi strai|eukprot:XP_002259027.1 hypothetical protein, conserved in Plasmodium species [Plasmodium knowlesi strain H]
MATIRKYLSKEKKKKILILGNIYLVTLLIWTLQCFNNNCFLNKSGKDNGSYYNAEESTSLNRIRNRCLTERGSFIGPEMDVLKDTIVNYLLGNNKNNNNDNREEMKPEVVEPRYDPPPRNYRGHPYHNGHDDIRTHENYDIREGHIHGNHSRQGPEVVSYYIPEGASDKDRMIQPIYYPRQRQSQRIPCNDNRSTSIIGYLKYFLLEQQLFGSPVLNKMAPIFFLMFLYYVISAIISNFRHIIALYFLAKIVKLHYNSNNN